MAGCRYKQNGYSYARGVGLNTGSRRGTGQCFLVVSFTTIEVRVSCAPCIFFGDHSVPAKNISFYIGKFSHKQFKSHIQQISEEFEDHYLFNTHDFRLNLENTYMRLNKACH